MKALKYLRQAYRITQEDIALLLDISVSHYSRLERMDSRNASIELVLRICKIFKINPCYLYCHELKGLYHVCSSYCPIGIGLIKHEDIPKIEDSSELAQAIEQSEFKQTHTRTEIYKLIEVKKREKDRG